MSESLESSVVLNKQEPSSVYVHENGQAVEYEDSIDVKKLLKCDFLAKVAAKGSIEDVKSLAKFYVRSQNLTKETKENNVKNRREESVVETPKTDKFEEVFSSRKILDKPQAITESGNSILESQEIFRDVLIEDQPIVIRQETKLQTPAINPEKASNRPSKTEVVTNTPKSSESEKPIRQEREKKVFANKLEIVVPSDDQTPTLVEKKDPEVIIDSDESLSNFEEKTELSKFQIESTFDDFEESIDIDLGEEISETVNDTENDGVSYLLEYQTAELQIVSEMSLFYEKFDKAKEDSEEKEYLPVVVVFKEFVEDLNNINQEIENFDEIISQLDRIFEVYESFSASGQAGLEIERELISSIKIFLELLGVEEPLSSISDFIRLYDFDFLIKNIEYFRILINERYRKEFKSGNINNDFNLIGNDDSNQTIFSWIMSMVTLFIPVVR